MHDLDRSILATLAYYGSFGWPLTFIEVATRLVPARRLGGRNTLAAPSLILERLERLCAMGSIVQEHGLYTLAGVTPGFSDRRIEQEKVWAQKWRHMRRKAWWLQKVPFVQGLYASGSLALGNMTAGSDWDMFVIAKVGRIYTARTGLLIGAWLMRALRTKRDRVAPDTFCFNHYVTTDGLANRHRSLYTAHGMAQLVPIFERGPYLARLWQANQWMDEYLPALTWTEHVRRSVQPSAVLAAIRRGLEVLLTGVAGDVLERILKRWQQRRIARTPATHERGGRVVASDRELEFHPRSFEALALARYNATLERFGMGTWAEHDSGLKG